MSIGTNYRFCKGKGQVSTLLYTSVLLAILLVFAAPMHAGDTCEDIEDEEEKLECYESELAEAEEKYESTSKKLSDIRDKKDSVLSKISGLSSQLSATQAEIDSLQAEINEMEAELGRISVVLDERRTSLNKKTDLRNKVLRTHYRSSMLNDLELFMSIFPSESSLTGFQFSTLSYMFDKTLTNDAIKIIELLNTEIKNFEADKKEAEDLNAELNVAQSNLVSVKVALGAQKQSVQGDLDEISGEEDEWEGRLATLQEEIDKLSSRQRAILSAKYGEGIISGYEAAEYKLPSPPYKPAFAAMSYGAFTHYNGMSQYGAKGRANDKKSYKDIIEFYYGEDVKKKDDFPKRIKVEGYGEMDFQKYLYGLAEMPSDWPSDALKAQAIAGRSYAYRRTKDGGSICTSQSCQVFLKSKSDNPPDRWKDAVDDTKGMIIGGSTDASGYGWYSSTAGGYVKNIERWDLDGDDWPGDAYEKKAKSPWFYKAWYTESYTDSSSKCGRSTPWLDEEEMADVLNAWVLWKHGKTDHISPVTTSCWGGDPYSMDKMADKAEDYDEEYTDVSDVWIDVSNSGYTSTVYFKTNRGTIDIPGDEFKTVFNLRAPAFVAIRSRLFDIEYED